MYPIWPLKKRSLDTLDVAVVFQRLPFIGSTLHLIVL